MRSSLDESKPAPDVLLDIEPLPDGGWSPPTQHGETIESEPEPANPDAVNPDTSQPADAVVAALDELNLRYEMELAAHRETTERLLAAKDETIAAQQAVIEQLRRTNSTS